MIHKLASAIYNDIVGGLRGFTGTPNMSIDQLEDEIINERLQIIKEYAMKGLIPRNDLLMSISCISTDCQSLDQCRCGESYSKPELHFEIPQLVNDLEADSIEYLGSVDKLQEFKIYTNMNFLYHKYKRRGASQPFVYIQTTPNENNMYDGWVFNAPLLKKLSIIAIFKDPRQLSFYECCAGDDIENYSFLSTEIHKRLVEKKLRVYRQLAPQPTSNTQIPQ